jgi:hypothetical protein
MEVFRFIDPSEVSSHRLHLVLRVAGAWATPDQFFGDPAVIFPSSTSVRFCRGANGISTVHTLRTLSLSHQAVNKERRSIADAAISDRSESVTRCDTVMPTRLGLSCLVTVSLTAKGTYLDVVLGDLGLALEFGCCQ